MLIKCATAQSAMAWAFQGCSFVLWHTFGGRGTPLAHFVAHFENPFKALLHLTFI